MLRFDGLTAASGKSRHACRRWAMAFALCLVGFCAPVSGPAHASFGDCADRAYRESFDPRFGTVDYDCVERLRLPIGPSEGEERFIRLIHDLSADWISDPAVMAEFERAVRLAAEALPQLGAARMDDITILLADDFAPPEHPGERYSEDIAAVTSFVRSPECRITIYLISGGATVAYAASVLVHEIFHCVQVANLSPAQMASGRQGLGQGGDWWIEGSAEWFTALALPNTPMLQGRTDTFDRLSPTEPLYTLAYTAYVFFLWLAQDQGPAAVLPFLARMADRAEVPAQMAAMRGALPQEGWLRFAQTYLAGGLLHPHGAPLTFSPQDGNRWHWAASRSEAIPIAPFVVARGWLEFDCAGWALTAQPAEPYAVRPDSSGDWADLPPGLDIAAGDPARFRFTGFNSSDAPAMVTIDAQQRTACGTCAAITAVDACLVRSWRQSGGGSVEWMRKLGIDIPVAERGENIVTYRADGTYQTLPSRGTATILSERTSGGTTRGDGDITAQSSGRWSAESGKLYICPIVEAFAGQLTITGSRGGRVTMPMSPEAMRSSGPLVQFYTCGDSLMETKMEFPGAPFPMTTTFAPAGP